jgi:hypothetical protein
LSTRAQLAAQLRAWNIVLIDCLRNGQPHTFMLDPKVAWGTKRSDIRPSNQEMKEALKREAHNHPQPFRSRLDALLRDASLADTKSSPTGPIAKFHRVIWTPPYQCEFQPIEKVWAYVKAYVARAYAKGRTPGLLREQTLAGFYGDRQGHAGITADYCRKLIEHVKKYANDRIAASFQHVFTGTVDSLTVLAAAQPLIVNFDDSDSDCEEEIVDSDLIDSLPSESAVPIDIPLPPPHVALPPVSAALASAALPVPVIVPAVAAAASAVFSDPAVCMDISHAPLHGAAAGGPAHAHSPPFDASSVPAAVPFRGLPLPPSVSSDVHMSSATHQPLPVVKTSSNNIVMMSDN